MATSRAPVALFLVALMALSFLAVPLALPADASGTPTTLAIQVAPNVLPADGGTYPSLYVYLLDSTGAPTLAFQNVTILLSSSTPAVGIVLNSSVTIEIGKGYAVADFQSSPTVGSTVITASSSGYVSAKATIKTAIPRGYPTSISVTTVPSEVNSTSASLRSGTVIVEFEDQAGQPAKTAANTQVSVYSSNPKILTLNSTSFTMKAGQLLKVLSFSTGFVPGSATVVASAPQMASGSAQVTVLGRPPLALKLFAQPGTLVTSSTGRLVVALTDPAGNPTRSPAATQVQLRSSSMAAVSVPTSVTIPAGGIYATVTMSSGVVADPNGATITASSSGLQSGFVTVPTVSPGTTPTGLKLYVGPDSVLADHGNYSSVVVSLVDSNGNPTVVTGQPYSVILTSSHNSSIGEFGSSSYSTMSLSMGQNNIIWSVPFTSTFTPGTTDLTVSAQDLLPATGKITTYGSIPSIVSVTTLFPSVPADGGSHPALQVSLEDSAGGPAVAPSPVTVYLSSSQTGIAQVNSPVVISTGASAAVVQVRTTSVGGTANITAYTNSLSSGYASSSSLVLTSTPSPSAIGASLAPAILAPSPMQKGSVLVLQLQDSSGHPAKARVPTTITVTSSNIGVINGTITAQVPQGASYVDVPLTPLNNGKAVLTVTSPGLASAVANFQSLPSAFVTQLLTSSLTVQSNQQVTVTFVMTVVGHGIAGANVTWSAVGGTITSAASVTDSQGRAAAVFKPTQPGVATVSANVTSRYAGSQPFSTSFLVTQSKVSSSILGLLLSFPYYLIIVGAAAAAVALAFLMLRRRRKRAAEAEGELLEEEQGFTFYRSRRGLGAQGSGLMPFGR